MKALQSDGEVLRQFKKELARSSGFCIGMALVTKNGMALIESLVEVVLREEDMGVWKFCTFKPITPAPCSSVTETTILMCPWTWLTVASRLALNLLRRVEGQDWKRFWPCSGRFEVVVLFGMLCLVAQLVYWSRIVNGLKQEHA